MSDENLRNVKHFRKRGRIPACVWLLGCVKHVYKGMHYEKVFNRDGPIASTKNINDVAIMRSAQPRISSSQTSADVKLISMLSKTSLETDEDGNSICIIFDARPFLSSVGNFARGGGFENSMIYRDMRLINLDIQNIHSVREAWVQLNGLFSICQSKNMNYIMTQNKVESQIRNDKQSTSWLDHVSQILCGAKSIANAVLNGCSVLIHCSDGWDRTAQLSALSQLLLDPYFRTLRGFQILIEKEWCSFGHQFGLRTGQVHAYAKTNEDYLDKDRSPIFVQWLDSVWQCVHQMPNAFEFNSKMLEVLFFHVYSCKYGTFLFNSEKERRDNSVSINTHSIWSDINAPKVRNVFVNTTYEECPGPISDDLIDEKQILGLWPAYIDVRCKFT
jgi:myotubularin-related protein 1/2